MGVHTVWALLRSAATIRVGPEPRGRLPTGGGIRSEADKHQRSTVKRLVSGPLNFGIGRTAVLEVTRSADRAPVWINYIDRKYTESE